LKDNKEKLDKINDDIKNKIEDLRKEFDKLNTSIPKDILQLLNGNKEIRLDIKNKHEAVIDELKLFSKKIDEQKKQFNVLRKTNIILFIVMIIITAVLIFVK
ncbi:MAG: hypothetical protein K5622_03030, partial [Endomicrobiaceae bacterium]|nr:hypothetical protein [Endomicrobiaceae bacterium]